MEEKKKSKILTYTIWGIVDIIVIVLGLSYAYWLLTNKQEGINIVNSKCLDLELENELNDISLEDAVPISDEDGLNLQPYTFTLTNNCNENVDYTVNLETLSVSNLSSEYVKVAFNEVGSEGQPKLLNSYEAYDHLKLSGTNEGKNLLTGTIGANASINYELRLWLDSNTPPSLDTMNKYHRSKIVIDRVIKLKSDESFILEEDVPIVDNGDGLYALSHNVSGISSDWNQTEYRYAGANVNNYVRFNNEIWRVIGKVNVQTNNGIEQRIKIIRQSGIKNQQDFGEYLYDVDNYTGNWGKASLKNVLNGLYYTSSSGLCNKDNEVDQVTCDFTVQNGNPSGLTNEAKEMIDTNILWNVGTTDDDEFSEIPAEKFYERERGLLADGNFPVVWSKENDIEYHNGIGLMYVSDYGFAVGGDNRTKCLKENVYKYNYNYDNDKCCNNDWLYTKKDTWTISYDGTDTDCAFFISATGYAKWDGCGNVYNHQLYVDPVVYLKPNVRFENSERANYGSIDNPFKLKIDEDVSSNSLRIITNNDNQGMWGYKDKLTKIIIENSKNSKTNGTVYGPFNEGENGSDIVESYVVCESDDNCIGYLQSNGKIILNDNSSNLFNGFYKITSIDGLENFDTSNVTNMHDMFANCENLTSLNLSNFDTSNVNNFNYMFVNDTKLNNITYGYKFTHKQGATTTAMFGGSVTTNNLNFEYGICPASKPSDSSWSNVKY